MASDTPLSTLPQYGGAGGSQQAMDFYAARDFAQLFGRNPSQSELDMLSSAYAGDPNTANTSAGRSAVAQYYNTQQNTPANLYAQQQQQWSANAPKQYDAVNQLFQSTLGRQASQDELSHYGTLLSSGQADPYQLSQFLQSLPEYQNAQDTQFRQGLDQQLQQSDQQFFNRGKEDVISRYAQMGRSTSPALDVALTDLQAQLNQNRGNYMAQLSASQYGGNKAAALSNYGQTQNDVLSRVNQNPQYQYQNQNALTGRVQNLQDYATQMNAFNQAQRQASQPGTLDYLNAGLNTANTVGKIGATFAAA